MHRFVHPRTTSYRLARWVMYRTVDAQPVRAMRRVACALQNLPVARSEPCPAWPTSVGFHPERMRRVHDEKHACDRIVGGAGGGLAVELCPRAQGRERRAGRLE